MSDLVNLQTSRRKIRDRSVGLVLIGALLLLPPIGKIALINGSVFGLPVPVFYVFTVWICLIIGAALLSKTLTSDDETTAADETLGDKR